MYNTEVALKVGFRAWCHFLQSELSEGQRECLIQHPEMIALKGCSVIAARGVMAAFAAALVSRGLQYPTVRQYAWAVGRFVEEQGGPDVRRDPMLARFYKAVRKATNYKPSKKHAVTTEFLLVLREKCLSDGSENGRNLWAGAITAFIALLRSAEYCTKRDSKGKVRAPLKGENIKFLTKEGVERPVGMTIEIASSKTNPEKAILEVVASWGPLCAVRANAELRQGDTKYRPKAAAYQMWSPDGKRRPMSYADMSAITKATAASLDMNPDLVATHSYRSGGATMYALLGLPGYMIQKLGRWRSQAFVGYLRGCPLSQSARNAVHTIGLGTKTGAGYTHESHEFESSQEEEDRLERLMQKLHIHKP